MNPQNIIEQQFPSVNEEYLTKLPGKNKQAIECRAQCEAERAWPNKIVIDRNKIKEDLSYEIYPVGKKVDVEGDGEVDENPNLDPIE